MDPGFRNDTLSDMIYWNATENGIGGNNTTFNGNMTPYTPYSQRPETYIVPVLFFVIFVVGVLGNGTLVVIFLRHSAMRNVPNTYILSLAVADLLVIIWSVPFTSTVYTVETWPWGELMCKVSETAKDISIGVSVFTLTALSADRFFAIVDPLKKFHTSSGGRKATRVTLAIAITIWLLAIICAIPAAVGSYLHTWHNAGGTFQVCNPFPEDWLDHNYARVMVMSKFLILYVIPLVIIAVFYATMASHLIASTKNVPGEVQGAHTAHRQIRARKKVAITVLVFVVIFAVCFLPSHVFMLFFYFDPNAFDNYNGAWHALRIIGFCLAYLNSCANPVALYWVSGAFRKHFNRYLLCIKIPRSRCNTLQGHQATTMTYIPSKRCAPIGRKARHILNNHRMDNNPETTITLLGPGNGNHCSKM